VCESPADALRRRARCPAATDRQRADPAGGSTRVGSPSIPSRPPSLAGLDVRRVWRLINLTEDTHPIHVHLDAFQVLDRHPAAVDQPDDGITTLGTSATVRIGHGPDDAIHRLDDNELGLKDTVRINPNEVVDIVVRFDVFCGRYMYHCHILEHEDHDMMRPFVIMPAELMPFMDMHAGHAGR
jgi:FtsP/CotA-like multicopper oxidase with cupredoxin domain